MSMERVLSLYLKTKTLILWVLILSACAKHAVFVGYQIYYILYVYSVCIGVNNNRTLRNNGIYKKKTTTEKCRVLHIQH